MQGPPFQLQAKKGKLGTQSNLLGIVLSWGKNNKFKDAVRIRGVKMRNLLMSLSTWNP